MNPKVNIANTQHAAEMYKRGMSSADIGTILNVTAPTARGYIRKQGVPMRSVAWRSTLTWKEAVKIASEYGYADPLAKPEREEA